MILFRTHQDLNTVIEAANTSVILNTSQAYLAGVQVSATVVSAAIVVASGSISTVTDAFTSAAHGYYTGLKLRATTSGALPTPLALATDYYVIVVDVNTIKLATSLANALAGTAIDITNVGSGNQTLTPVSISGASYKLQHSADYDPRTGSGVWVDAVASESNSVVTNTITVTADSAASLIGVCYPYVRVNFAIAAGSVALVVTSHTKSR